MTITKVSLAEHLAENLGFSKNESEEFVKLLFGVIADNLVAGKNLKISGFGNFLLRDKRQRLGRNPMNGKAAVISARRVVVFRAGQKLKTRVTASHEKGAKTAKLSAAS